MEVAAGEKRSRNEPGNRGFSPNKSPKWYHGQDSKITRSVTVAEKQIGPKDNAPYKRMSEAEYQARRDKGKILQRA